MIVLTGHISPETAYVVDDYPYGFRLRTTIRYWIETTKHGQRVVSQTMNPKKPGIVWNKPKASTYSRLRVLYIEDVTGHVVNDGLSFHDSNERIADFEAKFAVALTSDRDQKELRLLKAINKAVADREAARKAAEVQA